jgi:polysaccharide export outer membrane protein
MRPPPWRSACKARVELKLAMLASALPHRARRMAALTLLAMSLASCGASPIYNWRAENALGYRIGPGDKLRLTYWNHKDLDTEVTVRPDGAFSMALVGEVGAAGRGVDEIAADVQNRLHKLYKDDNPVTVQVIDVKSYKIYVIGEVQRPNEYAPSQPVTVLMGLALAGGFTRFANPDRIVVVRRDARGERRIPFDYGAVVEHGDLQQNLVLQLGDTVIVP